MFCGSDEDFGWEKLGESFLLAGIVTISLVLEPEA